MNVNIIIILFCSVFAEGFDESHLDITQGAIKGIVLHVADKEVELYLGIPYAKPPVEGLRFKPPEPADPWDGVYDATKQKYSCPQMHLSDTERKDSTLDTVISEDCLFLNIWTPTGSKDALRPVVVWIHGGSFASGSSFMPDYDGTILSTFNDLVVVTINYRLGIFGFLHTGSPRAPGNVGLMDQQLALKWVQDNIEYFGGDPSSVTIAGEDAGAVSVNFHILSPLSTGLFHRAIMLSGSAYSNSIVDLPHSSLLKGNQVAEIVGCTSMDSDLRTNPDDVLDCLLEADAEELLIASTEVTQPKFLTFMPTFNNEFLRSAPVKAICKDKINSVDLLIGTTADEASLYFTLDKSAPIFPADVGGLKLETIFGVSKVILDSWNVYYSNDTISYYLKEIPATSSIPGILRSTMIKYASDYLFVCPALYFSERYADRDNDVFMYQFSYRSEKSVYPTWAGVPHASDLIYILGRPFASLDQYSDDDKDFSMQMMYILTTFAELGRPVMPNKQKWPRFTREEQAYVDLKFEKVYVKKHLRKEHCDYWRQFI